MHTTLISEAMPCMKESSSEYSTCFPCHQTCNRSSHLRPRTLWRLQRSPLQLQRHRDRRPDPEHLLPDDLASELPGRRERDNPQQSRPEHPRRLRQLLLPQPSEQRGPPRIRPTALLDQQRSHRLDRGHLRRQPDRLLRKLCFVDDQHGEY